MNIQKIGSYLSLAFLSLTVSVPAVAGVTISSPGSGTTSSSPVHYVATATASSCAAGVASMGIYVNNKLMYVVDGAALNTSLSLSPGSYSSVVEEWDNCGGATFTPVAINVGQPTGVVVTSPANNSISVSPVIYKATGSTSTCAKGVASMGIYVDNRLAYSAAVSSINTSLSLTPGAHSTVVEEWDYCGGASFTQVTVNVVNKSGVLVSAPASSSTVTSPVTYVASATTTACAKGIASMGVYVNNSLAYVTNGSQLDAQISLNAGPQYTAVEAWDYCGGASSSPVNFTVSGAKTITGISVSPGTANVSMGSTKPFTATATYSDGSMGNITSTATWSVGNTDVAAISAGGLATANASGSTIITATQAGVNGSSPLTVTVPPNSAVNIPTWHVDTNRSGLNAKEISLNTGNVNPGTFGKLFSYLLDGYAYAEPLLMSNVNIGGSVHNMLYVTTERDSVYAFDADNYGKGTPLWHVSLLGTGETPITDGPIQPYEGVTSTPVIDPSSNTLYVVSVQTTATANPTFRLNALDITTGAQKFGAPITISASVAGTNSDSVNGVTSLTTSCLQRSALLLAGGSVYIGFGSCHSGWLLAYNAKTLTQTGVFNASPDLNGEGPYASAGGVWMGSGGPVADSAGNIYIVTGNGPWDGKTAFSDSVLKFSSTLQLEDYFTPQDYQYMDCEDADMAAGGLMLIPGTTEVLTGGKTGKLYLVNSSNLGKEQPNDVGATQTLWFESDLITPYASSCTDSTGVHTATISSYEIFGTSAYFNGSVYLGVSPTLSNVPAGVRQFLYSGGALTPGSFTTPSVQENTRGTTPFISSSGATNGILWMIDTGQPLQTSTGNPENAILRAYDATNLGDELYNSSVNAADIPGYGIKFTSPVVGNGKVYISTGHDLTTATNPRGEVDVYGLN